MFSVTAALWALGTFAYIGSINWLVNSMIGVNGWPWRKVVGIAQFVAVSTTYFGFLVGATS